MTRRGQRDAFPPPFLDESDQLGGAGDIPSLLSLRLADVRGEGGVIGRPSYACNRMKRRRRHAVAKAQHIARRGRWAWALGVDCHHQAEVAYLHHDEPRSGWTHTPRARAHCPGGGRSLRPLHLAQRLPTGADHQPPARAVQCRSGGGQQRQRLFLRAVSPGISGGAGQQCVPLPAERVVLARDGPQRGGRMAPSTPCEARARGSAVALPERHQPAAIAVSSTCLALSIARSRWTSPTPSGTRPG